MGPGQVSGKVGTNMLQGTLDVFSLDEVLGLLSGANKSGVLNITGDRGVGAISISDGQLVAGSASSAPEAIAVSDVVFELLRFDEGSFSFDGNAVAEGEAHDLEAVLIAAHARLSEWRDIEAVVPTLDHHLALVDNLATSQVTLNESEWATIVAIGEGATVGVVASRLDLGEFDGSKRVKGLVERSLASISSMKAPAVETAAVENPVVEAPVVEAPVVETAVVEAPALASFEAPVFETPAPEPATLEMPVADAPTEVASFDQAPDVAPSFEMPVDAGSDEEIPPMPDAPIAATFDPPVIDEEIPPMPEPPRPFGEDAAIAEEFAAPIEAESISPLPAPETELPSTFGGLDPIGAVDMFEAPQRNLDEADGFAIGEDAPVVPEMPPAPAVPEAQAEMPPPPAPSAEASPEAPSFAPPAFDPDAFAVNDENASVNEDPFAATDAGFDAPVDSTDDAVADDDGAGEPDKGGSLLMRYLKSNG